MIELIGLWLILTTYFVILFVRPLAKWWTERVGRLAKSPGAEKKPD
jgi:hypothetical protein